MTDFRGGERRWVERLGNLRNLIRQEVIARQLAGHVRTGMSVLDVGCGQGTQARRLASAGCRVTGVDPSDDLLRICGREAALDGLSIELRRGRIEELDDILEGRRFDLVCCHGLMMYLHDRVGALTILADHLTPQGLLSVTFRNGDALAMRPALRGQWAAALSGFESMQYINELGLTARADRLDDVATALPAAGMELVTWYGVRIFNDAVAADAEPPDDDELRLLLQAEERAGEVDPYRWMASLLHVLARPVSAS